jgi:hypothetical protein
MILPDSKNTNFTKIGGTKNVHGLNSRGTSRKQLTLHQKFFQREYLLKVWSFLESLHRILSEK